MIKKKGISVIICCFNSASRLPKVLEFLGKQKTKNLSWEIIIVDNNSSDNISHVARQECNKFEAVIPFKVIVEPKRGLSYARFKGVREALYEFILFCDDDNWLDENYLSIAFEIMNSHNNVAICGGKSDLYSTIQKPFWFDQFEYAYAVGQPLAHSGYANYRKYLTGAGMVVRNDLFAKLDKFGFKSILSDRKGNSLSSGGDSELCLLALYLGYDLYYDERLRFTHHISADRLHWKYCVRLIAKGFAEAQARYYLYDYCFETIMVRGMKPDFKYAYKRSLRKPLRGLMGYLKNHFWFSVKSLFFSMPGSIKEVEFKGFCNKFLFAVLHRNRLKKDFHTIIALFLAKQNKHEL